MMNLQMKLKSSGALLFTSLCLSACGSNIPETFPQELAPGTESLSAPLSAPLSALVSAPMPLAGPVDYVESKIIGLRPLIPVRADGANMEPALRKTLDAYGLISVGTSGSCSGTHLGNGYVLTAGHCFLEDPTVTSVSLQTCPNVRVHWGYRGSPSTGNPKPVVNSVSNCTRLVYAELSEDRDFAILQVDNPPKALVEIATESSRTPTNTKITIFGYPMGRPLEWSQYCSAKRSVTVAEKPFSSPSRIAYQCDTQPGNSGSSVIAINSAGVPKVVAVHNAAAPDPIQYNIGTYMYDVRQTLLKNGILLDRALGATRN